MKNSYAYGCFFPSVSASAFDFRPFFVARLFAAVVSAWFAFGFVKSVVYLVTSISTSHRGTVQSPQHALRSLYWGLLETVPQKRISPLWNKSVIDLSNQKKFILIFYNLLYEVTNYFVLTNIQLTHIIYKITEITIHNVFLLIQDFLHVKTPLE